MSNAISQKEAVYVKVTEYLGAEFKPNGKNTLTEEQHKAVTAIIAEGFVSGTIKHRQPAKVGTMELALVYSKGLLTNWLKRDSRFQAPAAQ